MAELNCQMHVKTATDYDDIFLTSKSELVEYDNTISGLSATNVKGAIDELEGYLDGFELQLAEKANQVDLGATNAIVAQKADKSEVTNVMTPKGNIAYASLPTTGNTVGWYYYCPDGDGTHGAGNYVWNGAAWYFGGTGDEGYNLVTGEIEELETELFILKNRVLNSVAGYYLTTTAGQQVQQVANAGYSYAKAEVKGDKYYSLSISPSTSFSVVTTSDNIVIGLLSAYKTADSGYVYLMPSNAAYIYVCKNVNPLTNIVVFKGRTDIATIPLSATNYPFNTIVGISSNKLSVSNNFSDNKTVRQEIDDINGKLDNNNTTISKVDSSFTFYEVSEPVFDNTSSFSFVASSKNFIGFGLRIIAPKKIRKINAYFLSDNAGTGYCQIVDINNNIIATKSAIISALNSGTTEFDFGEIDLSSYNEVWVRFYGDGTAKPRRATHDLSGIVSSEPNKYMYMNSSAQWVVSSIDGYSIPFICITGYSESNTKRVFYCGSTREYTKLKDAIEEAVKYMDSTVYVDAEDFDLVQEFGLAYLNAYDGSKGNIGIFLKNRVHVIFASGSRVLFNYTGGNTNTETYFSPFNSGEHGFALENAWVEDTNSRYSMHDERNSASDQYHNIYKRCTFIHDSSTSSWGVHQALGGGLGLHGDILMEDCYAKTVGGGECISWHNATADAESKSNIVIRNCYLEGTFRVSNYGTSTTKSRAYCSGCSLLYEPILGNNVEQADNMELFAWNNTIRS